MVVTADPLISIVVPTCNRPMALRRCLEALAPDVQTIDAPCEVLVSDDGRSNPVRDRLLPGFPWVRWLEGPARGPAANRNHGARHARGKWLAFTDDDCLPDKDWLAALARYFTKPDVDVVEGRTLVPDRSWHPFRYGVENLSGGQYWTCNLAVRRAIFEQLGGFDEEFPEPAFEDVEFAARFQAAGSMAVFAEDAVVYHPTRPFGLRAFVSHSAHVKWLVLYENKAGLGAPRSAGGAAVALSRTVSLTAASARAFLRALKPGDRRPRVLRVLVGLWDVLLLPVVVPYACLWDLRFRSVHATRLKRPPKGQS